MSRAKKNRSTEIKRTDGRKNNKRLAPKPISTIKKLQPARQNKAKRERISSYATKAIWFMLFFKCYETACNRLKQEVKYTVKDLQLYFTGENYKELVPLIEKDLMEELGINLEEIQKKTMESLT